MKTSVTPSEEVRTPSGVRWRANDVIVITYTIRKDDESVAELTSTLDEFVEAIE